VNPLGYAAGDLTALLTSFRLALLSTALLLVLCTPLAWWLATTRSRFKPWIETIATMPLVLPPTVLGFYLLWVLGPNGWLGGLSVAMGGASSRARRDVPRGRLNRRPPAGHCPTGRGVPTTISAVRLAPAAPVHLLATPREEER